MWKSIKNLFSKPKTDALARYRSPAVKLTLLDFQKNEQLVTEAIKLSTYPIWRVMMDVMRNECLANSFQFVSVGVPLADRAVFQAQVEGYMMAINNLESMSSPLVESEQVEATFAPEEG